jgi:ABC-type polysaccharide/polyol phosphate export permease
MPIPYLINGPFAATRRLNAPIDGLIALLMLEKSLVLRNIRLQNDGTSIKAFNAVLRAILVINAHVWVFWTLGRGMPGSISYVAYNAGGFTAWMLFGMIVRCSKPNAGAFHYNKNANIKWVHAFTADIIWETSKLLLGFIICLLFYYFFSMPFLGPALSINVPLLVYTLAICIMLGVGFGLILSTAQLRWPALEAGTESLMWIVFITSGVYTSYINLPRYVAEWIWYNPLVTLIEFSRKSLYHAYPTDDLSLVYASEVAMALLFVGLGFRRWNQRTPRQ